MKLERLRGLILRLKQNDAKVCEGAPDWIVRELIGRSEEFLDSDPEEDAVERFVLGGVRFVADQCIDCDCLLKSLSEVLRPSDKSD